jgi:hypothetical protein
MLEEVVMDFIERLFGIAPDGGNGSLEALYVVALAVGMSVVIFRRSLRHFLATRQRMG